jgi:hypothetical protein
LNAGLAAETQPAAIDSDEARAALANNLEPTAAPQTKFRDAANPARLSGDFLNLNPFAGFYEFQR